MLIIDKDFLDKKAKESTKSIFYFLEGFHYHFVNEIEIFLIFLEYSITIYLIGVKYTVVNDGIDTIKIDCLSNYSRPVPEESQPKLPESNAIDCYEAEIAGKEKKRFDMLELDKEG